MPTASKKTKARPGPKPRGPFEGKRKTLTTRITEETRRRLDEAAEANDRSLSQEIEIRLDRSFLSETARFEDFGGRKKYELARLFALTGNVLEPPLRKIADDLRAQNRFPADTSSGNTPLTWADNLVLFQYTVALLVWTARQIYFRVPANLDVFMKGFGLGDYAAGFGDLYDLGEKLSDIVKGPTEGTTATKD